MSSGWTLVVSVTKQVSVVLRAPLKHNGEFVNQSLVDVVESTTYGVAKALSRHQTG